MKILDMPIEWQQRSANTFSMPMPIKKTDQSQWFGKCNRAAGAAAVVAGATPLTVSRVPRRDGGHREFDEN